MGSNPIIRFGYIFFLFLLIHQFFPVYLQIVTPGAAKSYSLASSISLSSTAESGESADPNSSSEDLGPAGMNVGGIFGLDLTQTFNTDECEAPEIIKLLTNEIERKAKFTTQIDLYKLYRTKIPLEHLIELRDKLNINNVEQLRNVNITNYEIQYLVSILKRYLRELPDPLIPVNFYEQFISTLKQQQQQQQGQQQTVNAAADKQVIGNLMHLVNNELPVHHRLTLKWLMSHLCKIILLQYDRGNREYPLTFVQNWCHIFIRPPWEKIK